MTAYHQNSADQSETLALKLFVSELWSMRWFLIGGALIGLIIAFVIIVTAKPYYKASMMLAPAEFLAGSAQREYRADDKENENKTRHDFSAGFMTFSSTFSGVKTAAALNQDPNIAKAIAKDSPFGLWRSLTPVSPEELSEYIKRAVRLTQEGQEPAYRLTYHHPDPQFAKEFLTKIHEITDRHIRSDLRESSANRIQYLKSIINHADNPEHKRAMTDYLLAQERLNMLVTVESPFAAAVLEPAYASAKPVWPDKPLTAAVLGFVGLLLGYIAGLITRTAKEAA